MIRSLSLRLAGLMIAGVYLVRGVSGAAASGAFERGASASSTGRYAQAVEALADAKIGGTASEAAWLAGEARLGLFDRAAGRPDGAAEAESQLAAASREYLGGMVEAPASGWFLDGLAEVYARRERARRASRPVDLSALADRGPWSLVGDDGRIEIGLIRLAIEREPATCEFRDGLVFALQDKGLRDETVAAVRASAEVLPDFSAHPSFAGDALPPDLLEAFYRASRASVGGAPLQSRERQLLGLGRLGERLGHFAEAEADLREALLMPGSGLAHAEDAYYLATLLIFLGRFDAAAPLLASVERFDVFVPNVWLARGRIAERQGRLEEALTDLDRARSAAPRRVDLWLGYAALAGRLGKRDQAAEALRWVIVIAPGDPEPRIRLAELFLDAGDRASAAATVAELKRVAGDGPDVLRLEKRLAGAP